MYVLEHESAKSYQGQNPRQTKKVVLFQISSLLASSLYTKPFAIMSRTIGVFLSRKRQVANHRGRHCGIGVQGARTLGDILKCTPKLQTILQVMQCCFYFKSDKVSWLCVHVLFNTILHVLDITKVVLWSKPLSCFLSLKGSKIEV